VTGTYTYLYRTNIQGDVLGVYNTEGTLLVSYVYDAWGNFTETVHNTTTEATIASSLPFRYRSYYYDTETNLYYLNTRYYDPQVGRFINADGQLNTSLGILGLNQFSYCLNNPVNMEDIGGNKPEDLFDTMDEAARDAAIYLGELSWENEWEYATAIYCVKETIITYETVTKSHRFLWWTWTSTKTKTIKTYVTKYTYKAVKTSKDNASVLMPFAPIFKKRVAMFHTHPMGSWAGITRFSSKDIELANFWGIPIYVHGPNGELRKYDPKSETDILIYSDLPVSPKTPWLNEEE